VATFIGVVCLRAAIALYNKAAGGPASPQSVPVPEFEKAALAIFVTAVLQFGARLVITRVLGTGAVIAGMDGGLLQAVGQLVFLPVSVLAMAFMLTAILPTTFGRALLVTLCYCVVAILMAAATLGLAIVVLNLDLI